MGLHWARASGHPRGRSGGPRDGSSGTYTTRKVATAFRLARACQGPSDEGPSSRGGSEPARPLPRSHRSRRCEEGQRVIRCRFIFSGKNNGLTPDFPPQLSADSGKNQIAKLLRDATELCGELNNRWLETITLAPKKLIRTRRASEGSASEPSLARRVSMCKDAKLSCRGNTQHIFAIQNQLLSRCADAATRLLSVNDTTESEAARIEAGE